MQSSSKKDICLTTAVVNASLVTLSENYFKILSIFLTFTAVLLTSIPHIPHEMSEY
jgi:hypothetical protein